MLKLDFGQSEYVNNIFINKRQRSAFAKFRCGVAPIRLETDDMRTYLRNNAYAQCVTHKQWNLKSLSLVNVICILT